MLFELFPCCLGNFKKNSSRVTVRLCLMEVLWGKVVEH